MPLIDLWFDTATAQSLGRRACQEDAVLAHFPQGAPLGFAVLADGMGGHAAGDVASRIVLGTVFGAILRQTADPEALAADIPAALSHAARSADNCLAAHMAAVPETAGMGATLVIPLVRDASLWWLSIGDSPLYLYRDRRLRQLNEDHSLAPQIDMMIARGLLDPAVGRDHPDRNVLTSVLHGQSIARIDCSQVPLPLRPWDMIILASDGLQALDEDRISALCATHLRNPAARLAEAFMSELAQRDDPDQDNATCAVIRVLPRRDSGYAVLRRFRRVS
ncbi:MAG: serine/threonine-protein phosphatase [Rubellimicrobium sp.]|nr:serine/threonine-protein phosphatase [Rubellimicrobium sp.]